MMEAAKERKAPVKYSDEDFRSDFEDALKASS